MGIGLLLYAGLFLWSDRILAAHSDRNPFHRISAAPARTDWIVLGSSHAMPLGFGTAPALIEARTGQVVLTLGMTGGGPFTWRLIAERYFADHTAGGVLIVLDDFAFAAERWNAGRMDDADMLPKIPADRRTLGVLTQALPRGLPWTTWAGYATGFARINDGSRFQTDRWDGEAKFDHSPRPSEAADRARIDYLYPGPPEAAAIASGLADLEAVIQTARSAGARVVVIRPPLPARFRARLPELEGFEARLSALLARLGIPLHDASQMIPESTFYFDADHLNRQGVERFLDEGLAAVLGGGDDGGQ